MLLILCLLSQLLAGAGSELPHSLITPCQDGDRTRFNFGKRGKVVYYSWSNHSCKFTEHCNFNDEKGLVGEDYMHYPDDDAQLIQSLIQRPKKSQGQAKQDAIIASMFNSNSYPNPFYVDMAANHWIAISNTFLLDSVYKWNGICIEPTREYLAGLVINRTCTVVQNVVGAKDNDVIEYVHRGSLGGILGKDKSSGMDNYGNASTLSKQLHRETLHTVSLTTILKAFYSGPSVIEYLSLDVEGAEFLVLSGLDLKQYVFLAITVEQPTLAVHTRLITNDYHWVVRLAMFGECLYIHKTHKQFDAIMSHYRHARVLGGTRWKSGKDQPLHSHKYLVAKIKK